MYPQFFYNYSANDLFKNFEVPEAFQKQKKQQTMDLFTLKGNCEICDLNISPILCKNCQKNIDSSLVILKTKMKKNERNEEELKLLCTNCVKFPQNVDLFTKNTFVGVDCCENLDCNIFFERCRVTHKIEDDIEIKQKIKNIGILEW